MPERILVVEDESVIRNDIAQTLRIAGYDVAEAADGTEAVKLLDNEHFDVVVTDFSMPRLDGIRLAERIHRKTPDTLVIFASAYISMESAKGLLAGIAEVLPKPIESEVLLSTIKRFQEQRYPLPRHPGNLSSEK
jgi:CheY-like chemotaxis protein